MSWFERLQNKLQDVVSRPFPFVQDYSMLVRPGPASRRYRDHDRNEEGWAEISNSDGASPRAGHGPSQLWFPALKSRAAALVLDAAACALLFWQGCYLAAVRCGALSVSVQGNEIRFDVLQVATGFFLLASGLYFVAIEWLAGATIGKLLCRLRVECMNGHRCGFVSAFLRTLLRPIDIAGAWLLMLAPPRGQRLGDRIAGTVVAERPPADHVCELPVFATWEQRAKAGLIDAVLVAGIAAASLALAGCISARGGVHVNVRGYPLAVAVLLAFFYYVIAEGVYGATPGKTAARIRVVYRTGAPCDFTAATWRALLLPVEALTLGLAALFSIKVTRGRQRLGDVAAGTVVVAKPR
jgi:uncharacterized RDD family membrane protein YckC